MLVMWFVIVTIAGSCCSAIAAARKNRDVLLWTIAGAASPAMTVGVLALLPAIVDPDDIPDRWIW